MTLPTLAIQAEAWLQEELGAEHALLAVLVRTEAAARAGSRIELERCGHAIAELLAPAGVRDARRGVLLEKLSRALALPARGATIALFSSRLQAAQIETRRLETLRTELREVATAVVRVGRRLAAMAQYHRGVMDELCRLFQDDSPRPDGQLIDARG